ncbi:MAG: DMT family transporter [Leptolyngbyaceae cyanobacterium SL_5_9]|nr:DMT family transporter [Leptolyngbyaceae cyanobacterium SL_5_9]NJO73903.1 DMT family transporter [Leptolyngbyaceae cyanobacterium RM1_406_9]
MTAEAWFSLILLSVLWGGSFFFIELTLKDLQPLTVVLGRVMLAAIALTTFAYFQGHRMPTSFKVWREFLVMGALNNLIPFSLISWGQMHIDSSLAAILNATTPVFAVVLAHFLTPDERLTVNRMLGVICGFCGVAVLVGTEVLGGLQLTGLGQFAVLLAAFSYACAGIYGRRFRQLPATVAAAGMVSGTAVMITPLALVLERPWTTNPDWMSLGALLALGLLSTAIAYLLYFYILAIAGATNLLLVTFLIPLSALLLGVLVLGERLEWNAFAGMVLIFVGLAAIDGRLIAVGMKDER